MFRVTLITHVPLIMNSTRSVTLFLWMRILILRKVDLKKNDCVGFYLNVLLAFWCQGMEDECIFRSASRSACKHLWKCCVEQHAFFRLPQTGEESPHQRKLSFTKSSFRHTWVYRTSTAPLALFSVRIIFDREWLRAKWMDRIWTLLLKAWNSG